MPLSARPMVSVSIVTYNHASCITQALDGALMQETDFEYEILVGEDDSSDGTREIVKSYAEKYPDKIRLFLNDRKNVIYIDGQATGRWNLLNNFRNAKGKYVALLEGDDYWTDPCKLQKQVDFMESDKDCALVFHRAQVVSGGDDRLLYTSHKDTPSRYFTEDELIVGGGGLVPTASMMLRADVIHDLPNWFASAPSADYLLVLLSLNRGRVFFQNEVMSVYRVNVAGSATARAESFSFRLKLARYAHMSSVMREFNRLSNFRFRRSVNKRMREVWYRLISAYLPRAITQPRWLYWTLREKVWNLLPQTVKLFLHRLLLSIKTGEK